MKNTLKQYVDYIVNGGKSTMLGIGPMSPALIQACFELGKEKDLPLMFIASRNQVDADEFGAGYVNNWDQFRFAADLKAMSDKVGFEGDYFLYRDHGGPWQRDKERKDHIPEAEAMALTRRSYQVDIGSICGGKLSDYFGRRKYLLYLSFVFFFGAMISALSPTITILLIARFLLGYAVGGASVTAPTFISEVAPTEMRGKLTGLNEVAIVIGQLAAFAINAIIGYVWGHLPNVWRYMLIVQAIPAMSLLIGMWRAPESPRWLVSKNRKEEALAILKQIRPVERAKKEFEDIVTLINIEAEKKLHSGGSLSIILNTPWIFKLLLVGIAWAALQQTTGVNVIMYYGTEILRTAGFSERTSLICNVLNGVFSVGVMQGTMGFLTWVVLAELFPLKFRGLLMGISVFFMWIMNAIVSYLFPVLQAKLGLGPVFLIFAIINYLVILFVIFALPETSNKSLEQLEEELSSGK